MPTVAIYARVSLDEADENKKRYQEPENQLEPLRTYAKAMEWTIIGEYVDRASGANANRPEFRRMMQDALMNRFNGIVDRKSVV